MPRMHFQQVLYFSNKHLISGPWQKKIKHYAAGKSLSFLNQGILSLTSPQMNLWYWIVLATLEYCIFTKELWRRMEVHSPQNPPLWPSVWVPSFHLQSLASASLLPMWLFFSKKRRSALYYKYLHMVIIRTRWMPNLPWNAPATTDEEACMQHHLSGVFIYH